MKTLEIVIPSYESAEITIDNHLVGYTERYYDDGDYSSDRFSFPLPEGNWRILEEDFRSKIKLGDFS